ncbi:hypothetical protein [Xanthomonas nasturtii]|uniref:hypothetical protein n=1 Tax=Xanthomonas nasturtii TaxID=1843581 RepID=UPI00201368A9|nr:hypothetical protein [Xanthomonas nasturtii]MCL1498753.1 hypothetical protein [Xanthomonas nasturtii]MCL1502208.1 hypothetical protein [Xanthomonas nasturtii]MCL1522565.1 hypothetical protein [Xanthomonas nasturtii]
MDGFERMESPHDTASRRLPRLLTPARRRSGDATKACPALTCSRQRSATCRDVLPLACRSRWPISLLSREVSGVLMFSKEFDAIFAAPPVRTLMPELITLLTA